MAGTPGVGGAGGGPDSSSPRVCGVWRLCCMWPPAIHGPQCALRHPGPSGLQSGAGRGHVRACMHPLRTPSSGAAGKLGALFSLHGVSWQSPSLASWPRPPVSMTEAHPPSPGRQHSLATPGRARPLPLLLPGTCCAAAPGHPTHGWWTTQAGPAPCRSCCQPWWADLDSPPGPAPCRGCGGGKFQARPACPPLYGVGPLPTCQCPQSGVPFCLSSTCSGPTCGSPASPNPSSFCWIRDHPRVLP